MLLHEIYGKELFKITKYEIDILRYRPKSVLLAAMTAGGAINAVDFGGYIEDTSGGGGGGEDRDNDDYRIHIPDEIRSSNSSRDEASGGILATGIKWLFGA
jgi:hypothetical protein